MIISEGQNGMQMRMGYWGLLKKQVFTRAYSFGILYYTHALYKLFCTYSILNSNLKKRHKYINHREAIISIFWSNPDQKSQCIFLLWSHFSHPIYFWLEKYNPLAFSMYVGVCTYCFLTYEKLANTKWKKIWGIKWSSKMVDKKWEKCKDEQGRNDLRQTKMKKDD